MRIAVLDKHVMLTQSLMYYMQDRYESVQYDLCAEPAELLNVLDVQEIDLILVEITMKNGLEVLQDVRRAYPTVRLLVLSGYTDPKMVRKAMQLGADGYLSKENSIDELVHAIDEVHKGNTYLGSGVRTSPSPSATLRKKEKVDLLDEFAIRRSLTRREKEILALLTEGKTNKDIGNELYISHQTVGVHRKNIMRKLRVHSSASLIKLAIEKDLV